MTNTIRTAGFRALVAELVKARTEAGMTQRDLAEKLGCFPATVGYIERGQRRLDVIEVISLAHAIGVSPSRFFMAATEGVLPEELAGNFSAPPTSRRRKKAEE